MRLARPHIGFAVLVACAGAASCALVTGLSDYELTDCPDCEAGAAESGAGSTTTTSGGSTASSSAGSSASSSSSSSASSSGLVVSACDAGAFACGNKCLVGSCSSCRDAPVACVPQRTCVPSSVGCAACADQIECWDCTGSVPMGSGGYPPDGRCVKAYDDCSSSCPCAAADTCNGPYTVCRSSACTPCGAEGTNNRPCRGGGICDKASGTCI